MTPGISALKAISARSRLLSASLTDHFRSRIGILNDAKKHEEQALKFTDRKLFKKVKNLKIPCGIKPVRNADNMVVTHKNLCSETRNYHRENTIGKE